MKQLLFFILFISIVACSSDNSSPNDDTDSNLPTIPNLIYPTDNLICIDNTLQLQWSIEDTMENTNVNYLLEVSKQSDFSTYEHTITTNETFYDLSFDIGTVYYWRVRSSFENQSNGFSEVYSFYTEGEGEENHLPNAPEAISPLQDAIVKTSNINLSWNATDVDSEDVLSYNVYCDTNPNPTTKLGSDLNTTNLSVNVISGNVYYWKVIVKDDKGGQAIGNIWSFSTE